MEHTSYSHRNIDYIFSQAWKHSKRNCGFLILITIVNYFAKSLCQPTYDWVKYMALIQQKAGSGATLTPAELASVMIMPSIQQIIIGGLVAVLVVCIGQIAGYRLVEDCVKGRELDFSQQLKAALQRMLGYIGLAILTVFIVLGVCLACVLVIALCAAISKSLIAFGMFVFLCTVFYMVTRIMFASYAYATQDMGVMESLSHSWHITKGNVWWLIGVGITAVLVNIVGFLCCCVGILYTAVITNNMLGETYHALADGTEPAEAQPDTPEQPEDTTSYNQQSEGAYQK